MNENTEMPDTNDPISTVNLVRVGRATFDGWIFGHFRRTPWATSRHCMTYQKPNQPDEGWHNVKTDGTEKDWVKSLLDEAGVPEYKRVQNPK